MSRERCRGWAFAAALALLAATPACTPAPTHPGADQGKRNGAEALDDERAIPVGLLAPSVLPSGVPVEADDTIWGSEKAGVTIVAFIDYECPFSARAFPTLEALQKRYGPSRLRIVLKHLPLDFHRNALPAAVALQAVRELSDQKTALSYASLLLENQHALDEENLAKLASEVGVSPAEFRSRLASPHLQRAVENDVQLAIQLGINGTPTFRVNGAPLVGAQPILAFEKLVERELVEVRKLQKDGIVLPEIYPTRVRENLAQTSDESEVAPVYRVPVGNSPSLGPKDALVTIVEFSEFQCPFCQRVQPTLDRLREQFPRDVRVVFKHLPLDFHEQAFPAAQVAATIYEERGNEAFWSAAARLFDGPLDDERLLEVAREHGLTKKLAGAAVDGDAGSHAIEADLNLADDLGARGTPHFFINGKRLIGARPYEEFERMVLEAMRDAKVALERGVLPADYYEALMVDADPLNGPRKTNVRLDTRDRPTLGPDTAPVVVHVFSDFECPYCARVEPTLAALLEEFEKEVRIVWHNLPLGFHERARPAASAALEAFAQKGNSAFWKMHAGLFKSHESGDGPDLSRKKLVTLAREIGLDVARFERALDDGRHEQRIEADLALARAAGIDGTPGFVIDGWMTSGARPLRYFAALVRAALTASKTGAEPKAR